MRVEKKAFAYRVPIGDYNYLQCQSICTHYNRFENKGTDSKEISDQLGKLDIRMQINWAIISTSDEIVFCILHIPSIDLDSKENNRIFLT